MANDFRRAFLAHFEASDTKISDLVSQTGVSRDVINKLLSRENSSTTVENAMLIAAYYGKTVNQLVAGTPVSDVERMSTIFEMLSPEAQRLLEAQMRGLLNSHPG